MSDKDDLEDIIDDLVDKVLNRDYKPITAVMSIANSHLAPLHARIEALEAALRKIAHGEYLEHETIGVALEHARSTAQAALAPEQDK